jgi:hypothetical protein
MTFDPSAASPFAGTAPNLVPNPPGEIPEAPSAGDAVAKLSPFREALDVDAIIANLTLDRPLKLFIPEREKYPDWEFRIINSIPTEMADAHNKGFREVSDEKLTGLFAELVAGTGKDGKAFRPILCARPKKVGDHVRKQQRLQLRSLYAGMDPKNKELEGKYTSNIKHGQDASAGQFSGPTFRIRT